MENQVLYISYIHKLIHGHFRERAYLYKDADGDPRWSYQCPVCPTYCERLELGYNHSNKSCKHK